MHLVFFDRTATPQLPGGLPVLSLRRDGNFTLSGAAVARHGLQEQRWVRLAQDADTGAWFLVFGPGTSDAHPFALRTAKGKGKAGLPRCFSAATAAKRLFQAFALDQTESSLRLVVHAPQPHDVAGALYPLLPEGSDQPAPAAVVPTAEPVITNPAPADELVSEPAENVTVTPGNETIADDSAPASSGPRKAWREEEINYLRAFYPTTPTHEIAEKLGRGAHAILVKASSMGLKKKASAEPAPAPAKPAAAAPEPVREEVIAPAPKKTFGLVARAEELTAYWYEREISKATVNELGEVLNLLHHVPKGQRGFQMNLVLERAEKEHTTRLVAAGKGGSRG